MVPLILQRVAGDASSYPFHVDVIPDVPLVPAFYAALMTPRKSHAVEELVNVELERLRHSQIASIKVDVVGEVVQRWNQRVIGIGQPLRRKISDQMVIPEHIGIVHVSANVELRRLAGK